MACVDSYFNVINTEQLTRHFGRKQYRYYTGMRRHLGILYVMEKLN